MRKGDIGKKIVMQYTMRNKHIIIRANLSKIFILKIRNKEVNKPIIAFLE